MYYILYVIYDMMFSLVSLPCVQSISKDERQHLSRNAMEVSPPKEEPVGEEPVESPQEAHEDCLRDIQMKKTYI